MEILLIQKCWSSQKNGKYKEAENYYKKTLKINPKNIDALFLLANLYASIGENQKSKKYYLEALKINPYISEIYVNYANLMQTQMQ